MRNRLLCGTAIGLALTFAFDGNRPVQAACVGVIDDNANVITCTPFIIAPAVISALDGDDEIVLDGVVVGLEDIVVVTGATGDDLISVVNGSTLGQLATGQAVLLGEDGDDRIEWFGGSSGSGGTATLDGGTGNDTLTLGGNAAVSAATLFGNIGQDSFLFGDVRIADASAATVDGGAGDDYFQLTGSRIGARTGIDGTITGGLGDDTFDFAGAAIGQQGHGLVDAGSGSDTLSFTEGTHIGREQSGSGVVLGGGGQDVFVFEDLVADDTLNAIGLIGDGTLDMGDGDDTLVATGVSALALGVFEDASGTLNGGAGNDSLFGSFQLGVLGNGTVLGDDGNDLLSLDRLNVGGGVNFGGTRSEGFIDLGMGDDTLTTSEVALIGLVGAATIAAGEGNDTLDFGHAVGLANLVGSNGGIVTIDLGADEDRLTFVGTNFIGIASSANEVVLQLGEGNDDFLLESTSMSGAAIGAGTGTTALLLGGGGDDALQVIGAGVRAEGDGQVTLDAGLGEDTFFMTSNGFIQAQFDATGSGQALVTGGSGADSLVLSDAAMGILGRATLDGGSGSDSIEIDAATQLGFSFGATALVRGGQGDDVFQLTGAQVGLAGSATVSGDSGADTLLVTDAFVGTSGTGSGSILGGTGQDTLIFDNVDIGQNGDGMIDGGSGADLIQLTNATQLAVNTSTATASLFGGSGADTVEVTGSTIAVNGQATLDAGAGDDTLTLLNATAGDGPSANASLYGGDGLDLLSFDASTLANRGDVVLDAGAEADRIEIFNASRLAVTGNASLYGADGDDTFDITGSTVALHGTVTIDLGADADTLTLTDATVAESLTASATILGGLGSDTLAASNSVIARDGVVLLDQGDGDDTLSFSGLTRIAEGSDSQATLLGGSGQDLLAMNGSILANNGLAAVDLGAGSDRASVFGSTLAGQLSGVARLSGGEGDDTLDFTSSLIAVNGQASLGGGLGDDTLTFTSATFATQLTGGATLFGEDGDDRVELIGSTFGDFGQALGFGGSGADVLIARSSSVIADNAAASFFGGAGADVTTLDLAVLGDGATGLLAGEEGDDIYVLQNQTVLGRGAAGVGLIEGGDGNDSFGLTDSDLGQAGEGTIDGGSGDDSFTAGGGSDLGVDVGASGSLLGGAGADRFTLLALIVGNAGQGLVDGGDGNDSFDLGMAVNLGLVGGGSGTLLGGAGDDNLTANGGSVGVDGSGTIGGGDGADSLDFAGTTIGAGAGSGTVLGDSGSDSLTFRAGATIGGGAASGYVDGGEGDDSLTLDASNLGGSGDGTMTGGSGDDEILLRNGAGVGALAGTGTLLGGAGADEVRFEGATLGGNGRLLGEGGDDTLDFSLASTLADGAGLEAGDGNDRVRIEDSTSIGATAMLDGGADNDTLELFGSATGTFDGDGVITSFETLQKTGTGTWNWDRAGGVFNTILLDEGTFTLLDETLGGATTIAAAATLSGVGTLVGPLSNAGRIVPGDDGTFGVLTIDGDYSGGGLLALDVMLGADGSPADLLRITGTTGGSTTVQVTNLGGLGADSVGNGILVIEVGTAGGSSADGHFALSGPVTVGMFEYGLVLQDDGNWYLTTNFLDETVDLTLGGSAAIAAWHAGLRSVDERLGELRQLVGPTLAPGQTAALGYGDGQLALRESAVERPLSGWLRIGGAFDDYGSAVGTPFGQSTLAVQAGFDGGVRGLLTGDDLLLAGVFATMTQARAEVHGTATELDLEGWGGGLYASYLWQGLYLDAVLKGDVFDLDYSIPAIEAAASQQALALGASLEVGWRFELGGGTYLEPQAQLSYLRVDLEDLDDLQDDTDVLYEDAQSLRGRVGLRLGATLDVGGAAIRPYAELSGVCEFLGETEATIGDNAFVSELDGNAVEVGLGLSVTDETGHLSLFLDGDYVRGEVGSSVQVQGGLRLSW